MTQVARFRSNTGHWRSAGSCTAPLRLPSPINVSSDNGKEKNHVLNSLTFGHMRRVSPLLHCLSPADVSPWESEVIVWLQGNSEKHIRVTYHLFSALEGTFLPQLEKGLGCDWDEIDYGEFDLHVNVSRYLINGEAVEQVWAAHWSMTCSDKNQRTIEVIQYPSFLQFLMAS